MGVVARLGDCPGPENQKQVVWPVEALGKPDLISLPVPPTVPCWAMQGIALFRPSTQRVSWVPPSTLPSPSVLCASA